MTNLNHKITLGFTGDFSFSGYFTQGYKNGEIIDEAVLKFFEGSDANVINFESAITECLITTRLLAHKSDAESLDFIKEKFANPVISLANNHMMDYNRIGMMETIENLESREIPYIGAGRDVKDAARYHIVEKDGFKVGIFAVQYKAARKANEHKCGPLHESHVAAIKETIAELKKKTDKIIVVYHGGAEFLSVPLPYVRNKMKSYLKMGCDIVVAHHPHVVQGYEKFGEKYIFYSLGNFMFDTDYQRLQENTDKGIVLKLMISDKGVSFDHMAIQIDRENHRVLSGETPETFADIKKNYGKLWPLEAVRNEKVQAVRKAYLDEVKERKTGKKPEPAAKMGLVGTVRSLFDEETYHKVVEKYGAFKVRIMGLK